MRRKTRKSLLNLGIFGSILIFIIYINSHQSGAKIFTWNKVRYQTTSTTLPEARGVCPGLAGSSKPALIVARVAADGDNKWLHGLSNLYHACVYTADAPLDKHSIHLQVPSNRGHEAMAYLTFIIDNYDHIPLAGAVFVHGTRFSWHNDDPQYDNVALLSSLNISSALAPVGYHNLRCDWSASTCPASERPQGSLGTSFQAALVPWDDRAVSDAALPGALETLFGEKYGQRSRLGRDSTIRSQCCAQFVVSRKSIWQHSRDEYVALRQWLLDGISSSGEHSRNRKAAPLDDKIAGRILSYVWHILFIQKTGILSLDINVDLDWLNSQACPRADDCYCRLYGRCNLAHCPSPGTCYGQYHLPPDFKLPKDWAATHS